jgi:hypothetical protein
MMELTAERKQELESTARRKVQFLEREYWKVRNKEQKYMNCPYCEGRSIVDGTAVCCSMFAKALEAILDRQEEINKAAKHARTIHTLGQMVGGRPN